MESNPYTREGAALLLGEQGEEAIVELLTRMGFEAQYVGGKSFDILLEKLVTVEVKTALPTKGSNGNKERWQFSLHKRGYGCPLEEHLLVLRCQTGIQHTDKAYHFVIPGCLAGLTDLAKIDITSRPDKYSGQWRFFLEAWPIAKALVALAEKEEWQDPMAKEIPF